MTCGLLLWGSAAVIHDIFILQKRAVRAIYNLRSRESVREIFKEINILTVASQYIYENYDSFTKKCSVHNLNTRNKNKLLASDFRKPKDHFWVNVLLCSIKFHKT
ncbi:unnamed protein product [Diatraea saccharalis]|uniref:Uncharacterized protein n=1 Tax=Diatraea saccharalis TaxID=40085 RepID=A0A9N9QWH5_9NEOP|nr:unnamed protein product [Diatraea saccharalis]